MSNCQNCGGIIEQYPQKNRCNICLEVKKHLDAIFHIIFIVGFVCLAIYPSIIITSISVPGILDIPSIWILEILIGFALLCIFILLPSYFSMKRARNTSKENLVKIGITENGISVLQGFAVKIAIFKLIIVLGLLLAAAGLTTTVLLLQNPTIPLSYDFAIRVVTSGFGVLLCVLGWMMHTWKQNDLVSYIQNIHQSQRI